MNSFVKPSKCFFCGGNELKVVDYLNYRSGSYLRNIGYILPKIVVSTIRYFSKPFSDYYRSIEVNNRYFSNKKVVYCILCCTGSVEPKFSELELDKYYNDFYWKNRGDREGLYSKLEPKEASIKLAKKRIDWLIEKGANISSIIDFGAGDCAASLVFNSFPLSKVCIVDKSTQTKMVAESLGVDYYNSIEDAPSVDLIFSAHSIEHVHDLLLVFKEISEKLKKDGYLFLEVPNIPEFNTFMVMVHTPHTYMFSRETFSNLALIFSFELISIESFGPKWSESYPSLGVEYKSRADLRVLMRKL